MTERTKKPTPEELLFLAETEQGKQRGKLKVFLGYASGVGKSFRLVDEGRRRKERGEDVIVGAIQPGTSHEVKAALVNLEIAPLLKLGESLIKAPVIDVHAILHRRPRVCLVDGLAYDNPPGTRNPTRWKDVQELLDAGIDIITSINIQYIAELRERVAAVTGKQVQSTVPQAFLFAAEEIVVVDVPPEMCVTADAVEQTGQMSRRLSELREIALLFAADVVDHQLAQYLQRNGLTQSFGTQERILVCVTPRTNAKTMLESGKRKANRFHGELIAAYVRQHDLSADDQEALERNLALARQNGAEVEILEGEDPIQSILNFASERGITQIFAGHTLQNKWWQRLAGSYVRSHLGNHVDRLIDRAHGMDVRVFPH